MLALPKQEPFKFASPKGDERLRISRSRMAMLMSLPFWGLLGGRLKVVEKASVISAGTDAVHLYYNPSYIAALTDKQLIALIAHEVWHVVAEHPWRRGSRHPYIWNLACDYAIDQVLVRNGFDVPNALINPDWTGWNAERIYDVLLAEAERRNEEKRQQQGDSEDEDEQDGGQQGGDGAPKDGQQPGKQGGAGKQPGKQPSAGQQPGQQGGKGEQQQSGVSGALPEVKPKGDVMDAPAETASADKMDWKSAIVQAAEHAKGHGSLPAEIAILVEDAVEARVDWKAVMRRFAQQVARADYSMSRPSMRYMPLGMYLPALRSEHLPPIVIFWDTSGSMMSPHDQGVVMGEVSSIIEEVKPERTHVVYFDAAIQGVQEFEPYDVLDYKPTGGGGTSFVPCFEWLKECGIEPACVIVVTDMYGTHEHNDIPPYPVLWASTTKRVPENYLPPFGEMVYLDFNE